jgi:rare lipoprotein A
LPVLLASCTAARYESYPRATYAIASWYGPDFHGRETASGEIFDMYDFTCAHREYPFGTKLRVTNISNYKTVSCVVNDRGPFVAGRDLDLSYAAAREIGLIGPGTCEVKIEYMGRDITYVREVRDVSSIGPFTIQVGSFRELSNAERLRRALELKYKKVYIKEAYIDGDIYYRVRVGKEIMKGDVYRLAKILADEGYGVLIVTYEERI